MKGIVICHHGDNAPFLHDLLLSMNTDYPVTISKAGTDRRIDSFELGAIAHGAQLYDEFIFLQDTCVIKDNSLFDKLFAMPGNVALTKGFFHYMGKYTDLPPIPEIHSKEESIGHETRWINVPYTSFEPDLPVHTDVFEQKHGRYNMKLENDYIIKYKGTWSI